jgi:hypothetical protein
VHSGHLSVSQSHSEHSFDHVLKRDSLLAYRMMRQNAKYTNNDLREIFNEQIRAYRGIEVLLDWKSVGHNLRLIRRALIPPCTSIRQFLDNMEENEEFQNRYKYIDGLKVFRVS